MQSEMDFDPDSPATSDTLFGLPHTMPQAAVVVFPVPFEATTSYRRGTAQAPGRLMEASWQVDLHDLETGEPWRAGIAMAPIDPEITRANDAATEPALRVIEAGGPVSGELRIARDQVDGLSETVNAKVANFTRNTLSSGQIPAIYGGDHSVPFGAIQTAARSNPGLGLVHVDAHADLRVAYEGFTWSHASIIDNLLKRTPELGPVVSVGVRDLGRAEAARAAESVYLWTDPDIARHLADGETWASIVDRMLAPLPKQVWVTFDVDGLDPSLCPGTGTPVPGGLRWREAMTLLRRLAESGRQIIGFDICEVGPGDWDSIVGARLLYKLAGWAIATRNPETP